MIAELLLYHVQHGISGITIAAVTCGSNENSSLGWHSIVSRRYVVVIVSDNTKMGSQSVKCFFFNRLFLPNRQIGAAQVSEIFIDKKWRYFKKKKKQQLELIAF